MGIDATSGNVDIAVGVVEGKVVARWQMAADQIVFDPQNAYNVGMALAAAAMEAHKGMPVSADDFLAGEARKPKITDGQRDILIGIVATQVKTLIERGRSPGYIAMHCVDAVLQEVSR